MPKYAGIRKIGSKWYYRFQYRNCKVTSKEYSGAEEAFTARLEHLKRARADDTIQNDLTVAQFCEKYIEEYSRHNVRPLTARKEEGLCRNHIVPARTP